MNPNNMGKWERELRIKTLLTFPPLTILLAHGNATGTKVATTNIGAICLRMRVFCQQLNENGGFWKYYAVLVFTKISSVSLIPIANL